VAGQLDRLSGGKEIARDQRRLRQALEVREDGEGSDMNCPSTSIEGIPGAGRGWSVAAPGVGAPPE
jgi:hypothetical protein